MAAGKPLTPWFGHDRTVAQQMMGLDRLFAEVEGKTVLDVGCAEGAISIECAKSGAKRVFGVEIREQAVTDALNASPFKIAQVSFAQEDANVFAPSRDYDIVLLLAVLHKLKNPTAVCARLAARTKDLVVIRLPPEHAPTIIDDRSGNEPHHIGDVMAKAGFGLEHESNDGPFGEWMGYYRRCK